MAPVTAPVTARPEPRLDEPTYSISEVAERAGVSPDTLRYYEREGLVSVDRDPAGRRRYGPRELGRIVFLTRLRAADVPINRLQRYVELVNEGDHTEPQRLALLEEHRDSIRERLAHLEAALAMIERKIDRYGGGLTACGTATSAAISTVATPDGRRAPGATRVEPGAAVGSGAPEEESSTRGAAPMASTGGRR